MGFKLVGFAVVALFAVGLMKFGHALFTGDAGPQDAPVYINEEFNDVGVGVVPEGSDPYREDPRWPVPYQDVPYGTDPLAGR